MNKRQLWKQIKKRGPIIWSNVMCAARPAQRLSNGAYMPQTYFYKDVDTYNSYSALYPVGSKRSVHEFGYYDFDEDEGTGEGWTAFHVTNPLKWKTERSFLDEVEK